MRQYDKLIYGILIAIIVPIISYGIFLFLYEQLDNFNILNGDGMAPNFRERTIGLLAIISNVVPMHFANKKHYTDLMRGIVFPTLIYVAIWMYQYGFELIGMNG